MHCRRRPESPAGRRRGPGVPGGHAAAGQPKEPSDDRYHRANQQALVLPEGRRHLVRAVLSPALHPGRVYRRRQAQTALDRLADSGFSSDDLHIVTGAQLIEAINDIEQGHNWLDRIRSRIADFLGTETYFIDQDLTLARQGGVFLLAYTPEEEQAQAVQAVLEGAQPVYARRYLRVAIDRIIEPPDTDDVRMRD